MTSLVKPATKKGRKKTPVFSEDVHLRRHYSVQHQRRQPISEPPTALTQREV